MNYLGVVLGVGFGVCFLFNKVVWPGETVALGLLLGSVVHCGPFQSLAWVSDLALLVLTGWALVARAPRAIYGR